MSGVRGTVLVVDDDASIRLLCTVNLELEGYRVREAARLDDARRVLATEPVDAVLLDVHVGLDDGRELLDEIRAGWPATRVALFTGSADADRIPRGDALISKPFKIEDLLDTVAGLTTRPAPNPAR
jgi:DNA-binding response OmpR family regulator